MVEEKGKTFCRCRKEIEEVIGGRRASMSDVFAMPYLQATIAEVFLFLKLIFCKSRCNQKFAVFKSKGYYVISTSSTSSLLPLMLKHKKRYQMQKPEFYLQGSAAVLCWTSVSSPRDNLCHLCWEVEELILFLVSYLQGVFRCVSIS